MAEIDNTRLTIRFMGTCLLFLALCCAASAQLPAPAVIPNPASLLQQQGEFRLSSGTPIVVPPHDSEAKRVAENLSDLLSRTHGLKLPVRTGPPRKSAVSLVRVRASALRDDSGTTLGPEGYRLDVKSDRVTITATTTAGLFYAGTTLWQLVSPREGTGPTLVAAVKIADAPRFAWRGAMLDSARHFQPPEFIRQFIDWMALHKLNVLHWHLTDDQSWRLEIKKYPRLTRVAAYRVPAGAAPQADIDAATGKPRQYGGFYSQQTVREIVAYATERGISIVPEIEMPGHATAPIVAYPVLGATTHPPSAVPADWGIFANVYNIDVSTFDFLENVLNEVMALFPSKFIHIGGDEVDKTQWKESPQVQARLRELGIKDTAAIQIYFTQRIGRFLQSHGRRLVGWDEILEPGLAQNAVVMSWRGLDGAIAAATKGYDTVLSPWPTLYFDNRQSTATDEPPGRARVISAKDVYLFEPLPGKLTTEQQRHVLGLQGNVWTEHIRTTDRVAAMTFPRAAVVAELGWSSPERRNWEDFLRRLAAQFPRYDALKMPYSDSAFAVQGRIGYAGLAQKTAQATVELFNQTGFGDIRYTLDGSEPSPRSPRYQDPLSVPLPDGAPVDLRAATFSKDARVSRTRTFPLSQKLRLRRKSQELTLCSDFIQIGIEDDAPIAGPRAVFMVDLKSPCWIFPQADLDAVTGVAAAVGQIPFNFQIGDDVKEVTFPKPTTAAGELEVRIDDCNGEVIARLPLAPATKSQAVTVLPRGDIATRKGKHDLCLRFAQTFVQPAVDPIWVLDWIHLLENEPVHSSPAEVTK